MLRWMRFLFIFTLSTAIASIALPARAEEVCKVTDPTGTPLNVRDTPNGTRIITTLPNDTRVYIEETATDPKGRPWVKVGGYSKGKYVVWGWVIREFISCYDR